MLKQLLEKLQAVGMSEADDAKIKPVAMQVVGFLLDGDSRVSDEDWAVITDSDLRKSMIVLSATLLMKSDLMKSVTESA